MGIGESALLRESRLVALLESTAIGDAAEDSRNELRIILVAETEEQLVFVVCVEIEPRIKCIAVFVQFWRIGEVRKKARPGRVGVQIQQLDSIRIQAADRDHVQIARGKCEVGGACGARTKGVADKDSRGRSCFASSCGIQNG